MERKTTFIESDMISVKGTLSKLNLLELVSYTKDSGWLDALVKPRNLKLKKYYQYF